MIFLFMAFVLAEISYARQLLPFPEQSVLCSPTSSSTRCSPLSPAPVQGVQKGWGQGRAGVGSSAFKAVTKNLIGPCVILSRCAWVNAKRRRVGCCIQALLEELEAGQEKLIKAQKHADTCQAKMCALEDK